MARVGAVGFSKASIRRSFVELAEANEFRLANSGHTHDRRSADAALPQGHVHGFGGVTVLNDPVVFQRDPLALEPGDGVTQEDRLHTSLCHGSPFPRVTLPARLCRFATVSGVRADWAAGVACEWWAVEDGLVGVLRSRLQRRGVGCAPWNRLSMSSLRSTTRLR